MNPAKILDDNFLSEEQTDHPPAEGSELDKPAQPAVASDPYMTPEFTKCLIEHMYRAKIAALRDAQE